jgi:multidrug efflux pump
MTGFNISAWALRHRALVGYLIVALALMGVFGYKHLGQADDPPFTFKLMVVRTLWTGATARETEQQITDKIEKKLQEIPQLDRLSSFSRPGESTVIFIARDSTPAREIPDIYYQVRKKVGDIRHTLPNGIQGPFFNDEFGDVYGNVFAVIGDGLDYAQLKDTADHIRDQLLRVKSVAKVDLLGTQDEKIFIEFANAKLATLGIDINVIGQALAQQNAITNSGAFETAGDRIYLRPSGDYDSVASVRETLIRVGSREFRIGDIATVKRGYVDPPTTRMRYMGQPAIGLGITMAAGGDVIELGRELEEKAAAIQNKLPVGVELNEVASQPAVVKRSIGDFTRSLTEAVIIVLVVNFFSLGMRTGMVVALSIPLVLAATFYLMFLFDVGLHKISLGALILALGLLVDDAIIAVEMMWVKMEQGWDRTRAAAFAYSSTAAPMLSGTLVTVAGFLPIATAASSTGEYTVSIFQVCTIALLVSWVAAVVVVPYLGYLILPDPRAAAVPGLLHRRLPRLAARIDWLRNRLGVGAHPPLNEHGEHDVYGTGFYVRLHATIDWCVGHRWIVIAATLATFALSIVGMGIVQKQFFPVSTRLELMVDLRLPEGSSTHAVDAAAKKLETILQKEPGIDNFVTYIGSGTPRFFLALDQQLPAANLAQFVILAHDVEARETIRKRLIKLFDEDFSELRGNITRVENGPPVGYPVQFRVSGEDIAGLRRIAGEIADVMRRNSALSNVQFDWDEESKIVAIDIDQDKAKLLGISSQEVANFLSTSVSGATATTYRERDRSIDVVLRGDRSTREQLSSLATLSIPNRTGKSVPLAQIARLRYSFEPGVIWRRNRLPTIIVRANLYDSSIEPATVTGQISPLLDPIRAKLPDGVILETGGSVEESAKGQDSINAGAPLFVLAVVTILMVQLQSFSRVMMVLLTAPLGLIGVALALLIFNKPYGFVAMLGTIALFGMIMRNSVILIDQIRQDVEAGKPRWEAIVGSAVRRFRPIVLTAVAAVLAMIPLARNAFFGPMAVSIMGGLLVATLLTVLFLPALYAAWYRVRRDEEQ